MTDARACYGPIRAATKGAFNDDEIEALAERLIARKARLKGEVPGLTEQEAIRQAARDIGVEDMKRGLISQRAKAYAEIAKKNRLQMYSAMSGTAADKLDAMTVGSQKAGFGGMESVDALGHAYMTELAGDLKRGLKAAGVWKRASGAMRDLNWEKNVAIEMARHNGARELKPTGDKAAVAAAKVMVPLIEKARDMQNKAGAWIGKLDGYIARQNHDALKVAGGFWNLGKAGMDRARAQWVNDILPLLDDKTFDDVGYTAGRWKGAQADPMADKRAFLEAAWYNIVTGNHSSGSVRGNDVEGFLPSKGKARAVSAERVLHFKSPEAWWQYHQQYGKGDLFAVVVNDLQRAARNTALMKRFGPNPEIAWQNDLKRFDQEAREKGDAALGRKIKGGMVQAGFDQVAGLMDAPEDLRLAYIGSLIAKHESVSKLGAMVLSAFPDLATGAARLQRAGVPFLEAWGATLGGVTRLSGSAQREAADLLDVGARTAVGHLSSGISAKDGALGWYTFLGRLNFDLQGADAWWDGIRAGVATMMSRHMGRHAGKTFDALPEALRGQMQQYGIGSKGWDDIRAGVTTIEGAPHVGFDGVQDVETRLRLRAMMNDIMDDSTNEGRGQERRSLGGFGKPGTPVGEAMRLLLQFKSFPVTYVNRNALPALTAARAGNIAPLATLIAGTIGLGFLSLQAKEISKGHDPRPMNLDTFLASMVQGGGLGIYGDFLFGEKNRMGGGLAETFGGPAVGDLMSLYGLWQDMVQGVRGQSEQERKSGFKALGSGSFRLAKGELPFANLWYTRAALDYLIFWRMQEAIDPGWASRYQSDVQRKNGASFWLEPTRAVS